MLSLHNPFQEVPQISIHSLYIESSLHACEGYSFYWQLCYQIARSADNKKCSIMRMRLIVALTHHFLMLRFYLPSLERQF